MATRIYLPSSGAAPISPAYDSGWENTAEAARLAAVTTPIGSSMADASITDTSTGSDADYLIRQWVIGPLAAQTISAQAVEIQIRANEVNNVQNLFLAWGIRVVSSDGSTVRGSVVPLRRDGTELVSGLATNRRDTLTSTAVAALAGDYMVIEIGTGGSPSFVGRQSTIRIGDGAASDLPEDDSSTSDLNPWIEFANDLSFDTSEEHDTDGATSADASVAASATTDRPQDAALEAVHAALATATGAHAAAAEVDATAEATATVETGRAQDAAIDAETSVDADAATGREADGALAASAALAAAESTGRAVTGDAAATAGATAEATTGREADGQIAAESQVAAASATARHVDAAIEVIASVDWTGFTAEGAVIDVVATVQATVSTSRPSAGAVATAVATAATAESARTADIAMNAAAAIDVEPETARAVDGALSAESAVAGSDTPTHETDADITVGASSDASARSARSVDADVEAAAEVDASTLSADTAGAIVTVVTVAATVTTSRSADGAVEATSDITILVLPALPLPALSPSTPTPATAAQVEDALAGRRGPVALRFRYTRRTRTNGFIDEVIGIDRPGRITLDNRRAVVRDLDVTFNRNLLPTDFNASQDILGIDVEVYVRAARQWVSMPVGLYVLDVSERRNRANNDLIPAKGADLAMLLVRSVRTAAYTVPAGTNYVTAVTDIIARHGLAYSIPASPLTVPNDLTWGPGTTDYQITRDLLFGINYYPLWADATGRLRSRERIDPATESAAVTYRDTAEPRLVSAEDDVVLATDRKPVNRAVVVIDDPRHADYGYALRENADAAAPNSTAALAYGTAVDIATSSADNPSVITTATAHGFSTGVQVLISGHAGSTPDINGSHIVDVLSPTTFSIPVDVSVAGAGGTVQATTVQQEAWDGDSTPPTKAIADMTRAEAIAESELRWAAIEAQPMELPTFIDPRRDAREFYVVDLADVEDGQLYAVLGWRMTLEPGRTMQHQLGRVQSLDLLSPPKG